VALLTGKSEEKKLKSRIYFQRPDDSTKCISYEFHNLLQRNINEKNIFIFTYIFVMIYIYIILCVCMSVCKNLNVFYTQNKIPHFTIYNDQ